MKIPAHIFREYDIRGVYGAEITEDLARLLGQAYARMLPEETHAPVVVGRDVRLHGPRLMEAVVQGITSMGRDVLDIGVVPTPLTYFAVFTETAAGCVMVTASHNPSEYNGFKMMLGRDALHGEAIQRLRREMEV
ncbi:MAG: phosphomannomutase, partial [Zetaproteobacteria bacterium]